MIETVIVKNQLGLHLRAAAELVRLAGNFKSAITLRKGSSYANGRSILGLLGLAAGYETVLEIVLDGDDAREAMEAVLVFFERLMEIPNVDLAELISPGIKEP